MLGSLCALTWRALFSGELMNDAQGWKGDGWCSLDARAGWSKALVLGAVSFWSACSGDTVRRICVMSFLRREQQKATNQSSPF